MDEEKAPDVNIIEMKNVSKRFNLEAGFFSAFGKFVYAVNDVSLAIKKNFAFGLVGESGCGKTTTARLAVRMYKPDTGTILFNGGGNAATDVLSLKGSALKSYRRRVRYVFQDPARSLNPRMNIYRILTDGWRWSDIWPGEKKAREQAAAILEEVGLSPGDLDRRPSDFSGGQRQRISIARSLLMEPDLLICDEIISALDVSIQGQILNLLIDLREKRGLSFLFIAHDLRAACYFCDRIAVMYRGKIMEEAPAADLYRTAVHPYTKMLFAAAAGEGAAGTEDVRSSPPRDGIPDSEAKMEGCAFAGRCPAACGKCFAEKPALEIIHSSPGEEHLVRCHFAETQVMTPPPMTFSPS